MRILIRLMALFAVMASAMTAPAMADNKASARMQQVLPYLEKFMDLPESERTLIQPVYRIKSKSLPETEIRAWYTLHGQQTNLTLNDRGELIDLPELSVYRANPVVETNLARNDVVLALRVRPNVEYAKEMDADELTASLVQADKGIRRMSGMFAFLRPKVKGYRIEILTGETADMVMKNGETRSLIVNRINPRLSYVEVDRDDLAKAQSLRFSAPPEIIKYRE